MLIITLLLSRGQLSWITAGIPTVVFFFLIIFQNRILLGATKKSVKQLFAEGVNRGLYGEQELILNENSIIESGKLMKTEYSYKIIERIEEDERSFYLYFGAVQAIIVKKQLLSGAEEEEQFREYIKSRRTNLATV